MMKTSAAALAAAILALSLAPNAASADWLFPAFTVPLPPFSGFANPQPSGTSWTDAILGHPAGGPPWATPVPATRYGCYFTRARLNDAWRRVEVCY
jgi:hypothetical protein